jgi:hypothetical protein
MVTHYTIRKVDGAVVLYYGVNLGASRGYQTTEFPEGAITAEAS